MESLLAAKNRLFRFFRARLDLVFATLFLKPPDMEWTHITGEAAYKMYRARTAEEYARRQTEDDALLPKGTGRQFCQVRGFCYVCRRWVLFTSATDAPLSDTEAGYMNWREQLACPQCNLTNRLRGAFHFLRERLQPDAEARIYVTEQITPFFQCLQQHYHEAVGSEYLGDKVPLGERNAAGIWNENLTRLTFADNSFDFILCFEVLEHVPNYRQAIAECARALKPGGKMLFTVPFHRHRTENTIRARLQPDGSIDHLLPPEIHGDPLSEHGCLCFQVFGWEMLDECRECGFSRVDTYLYWSREFGYLGGEQVLYVAHK